MKKIYSKIKALYVYIELFLTITIVIVLMYLFNSKHRQIRRTWGRLQTKLIGFNIEIEGDPNPKAKLLLINHASFVDIIVIEAIHPSDPAWVAKKEIIEMPIIGHILRAPKMIPIDRSDKKSMIKMIKEADDRIRNNRVITLFPEGTRGNGKKLLSFKKGSKVLAEKLDLLVQPIVLVNTRKIFDSSSFSCGSGTVKVVYMDVIDPKLDSNWYEKLQEDMQKRLDYELANNSSNR